MADDFDDIIAPSPETETGRGSFMPSARRADRAEARMAAVAAETAQQASRHRSHSRGTGRTLVQLASACIGLAVLAMVFAPIATNVFRTGAAATTAGFVAVGVGAAVGALLAILNDQVRYIVGWILGSAAAGLVAVTVAALVATWTG